MRFAHNNPELGGVEGVEALSCNQVRKSNFFITKTRQKALGLDRVTLTLQRNREKKPLRRFLTKSHSAFSGLISGS